MIELTISIDIGEYLKEKALKSIREKVRTQIRQAARAFLRAAMIRVPVQSGMAKGSFIPLATLLKVALPINPTIRRPAKYLGGDLKSPELGASLATNPNEIFVEAGDTFTFNYSNDVYHYLLNELTNGGSKTAPWLSFETGEAAFDEYIEKNFEDKLPNLLNFMKITTIKSGPNGITKTTQPEEEPDEPEEKE